MSGVLIIGAGPAGLAMQACLQRLGVDSQLVDLHGEAGGAYRRMYEAITLSSPTAYLGLPYLPLRSQRAYLTVGEYNEYLSRYARHHGLHPRKAAVKGLSLTADGIQVAFRSKGDAAPQGSKQTFRLVVVATGMCENPFRPIVPGLAPRAGNAGPEVVHSHDWRGPAGRKGAHVLIVGRGMRAVEIAEECATAGMQVTVSARGPVKFTPRLPGLDTRKVWFPFTRYLGELPLGRKLHCEKPITFRPIDYGYSDYRRQGVIRECGELLSIDGARAQFADGSQAVCDLVVLATGYKFSLPFVPPEVARTPAGFPVTRRGESVSWPGLFFLGSPCARGVYSQFIHGISQDSRRIASEIRQRLAA